MALRAFRVKRRIVWDHWEYAPAPGSHESGHFDDGSIVNYDWLWRQLGKDYRVNESARVQAMLKANCMDARSCEPMRYAGDIILVDDADPRVHRKDDEGRVHDRIGTMIDLKNAFAYDASIDVSKIAGTRRMQRIRQGPPTPGELLPAS